MAVEFEQIQGRPINLKPMPLKEAVKLRPGDKVYLWWAKDGNLMDVRVNGIYEIRTADRFDRGARSKGVHLGLSDGDIDVYDGDVRACGDLNRTDWAGRGDVYFYHPPE